MDPIVIAITGASALQLGECALKLLLKNNKRVYLILSKGAYEVAYSEQGIKIPTEPLEQQHFWRTRFGIKSGELKCYKWNDLSASIASGSFKTKAMVIVPCTMGTLARIASGNSFNLIERCADVHLKEGRELLIVPRESPFSKIHLSNMLTLSNAGAKIIPPIPSWYSKPKSIEDIVTFMTVRLFDSIGENLQDINRWKTK